MKPFDELNIIDKARLLHELFPDEIKGLIEFVQLSANGLITDPDKVKDDWGGSVFSADGWIKLAEDVDKRILKNNDKLVTSKERFSDQLFDGYQSMFMLQCLLDYLQVCKNSKFIDAIKFLFDL